jgi:hypothetical protein
MRTHENGAMRVSVAVGVEMIAHYGVVTLSLEARKPSCGHLQFCQLGVLALQAGQVLINADVALVLVRCSELERATRDVT